MPADDLHYVYLPFTDVRKSTAKTADGVEVPTRIVSGIMTDETVDLDGEIVDYESAKKAATEWFRDWANIREQHSSNAIGTGIAMVTDDAKKEIRTTIEVVDPLSIVKIDKGVLKGQSVGLKGARKIADATAPKGRLVGFTQVEDSLVDRPANPTAKFAVVKMAKDGSLEIGKALQISEAQINKIASAEENKLAATEEEKAAADLHAHEHEHDSGTDHVYSHSHGHGHDDGLHADGQYADHSHQHSAKDAEAEVTKDSIIADQAVANSSGEGVAQDVTSPSGADAGDCHDNSCSCGGCGPSCTGDCCDSCTMGDDLDRRETMHFAANATTTKTLSPEEALEMSYSTFAPQIKSVLEAGDAKAALALMQAAEIAAKGSIIASQAGGQDDSDEVEVVPAPAGGRKKKVPPEAGGAGSASNAPNADAITNPKAAIADSTKAFLSEVTKAVDTAVKPLADKIAELEKRGMPGPILGSRLLDAPKDVQAELLKTRLGSFSVEQLQDLAENYPDGQIRMGLKQVLADIQK